VGGDGGRRLKLSYTAVSRHDRASPAGGLGLFLIAGWTAIVAVAAADERLRRGGCSG